MQLRHILLLLAFLAGSRALQIDPPVFSVSAASSPATSAAWVGGARAAPKRAAKRAAPKRFGAKRATPEPELSGKVDGLTKIAPFKFYALGAATVWAIVGSAMN